MRLAIEVNDPSADGGLRVILEVPDAKEIPRKGDHLVIDQGVYEVLAVVWSLSDATVAILAEERVFPRRSPADPD